MTRIDLVAVGLFAVAGCGVDGATVIPDGLVVSTQTPDHVAGTFGSSGEGLQFDFSHLSGTHEAILSDARGKTLEDVVFVDGGIDGENIVEAVLLEELWVVSVQGSSSPTASR